MAKGILYEKPDKYKYSTVFAAKIHPITSEEKDKYLSLASLNEVRKFLPDIDIDKNIDLLPFSANAFVANRLNENLDGIGTKEAISVAGTLKYKFLDLEHERSNIRGVILTAGYSEFGTDKLLEEKDIKDSTKPFNVVIGGLIWRVVDSKFADFIEDSNDPASENYLKASISWEVAFSEFNLIIMEGNKKNFEDGEIVTDEKEISKLEKLLISSGGKGKNEAGKIIGRVPINDVLGLGVGAVANPAAKVKGIAVPKETEETKASIDNLITIDENLKVSIDDLVKVFKTYSEVSIINEINNILGNDLSKNNELAKTLYKESIDKNINFKEITADYINNLEKTKNSILQNEKTNVNQNIQNNTYMKLTDIKSLTDENLKESKASDIHSLYDTKVKEISDEWEKKSKEKDNAIKASTDEVEKLNKSQKDLKAELDKTKEDLDKVIKANEARENVQVFSSRMESLESEFDLTDDQKNILAEDIKGLDNTEESFAKFMKKQANFLKKKGAKNKNDGDAEDKKDGGADEDTEDKNGKKKTAKASVEDKDTQKTLDDALKNGEKQKESVANTGDVNEPSLIDKAKEAFGIKGWTTEKRKGRK